MFYLAHKGKVTLKLSNSQGSRLGAVAKSNSTVIKTGRESTINIEPDACNEVSKVELETVHCPAVQ